MSRCLSWLKLPKIEVQDFVVTTEKERSKVLKALDDQKLQSVKFFVGTKSGSNSGFVM